MMMTNGFGAVLGSFTSGWAIDKYFTKTFTNTLEIAGFLETETTNSTLLKFINEHGTQISATGAFDTPILMKDWHSIWLSFAIYSLVIAIAFAIMFKHKHTSHNVMEVSH